MAIALKKKEGMTAGEAAMTPREYCCYQRVPAFKDTQEKVPGKPLWKKASKGLIAVLDGSKREYVASGLIFGVELDEDGNPVIASYWDSAAETEGLGAICPRVFSTVKSLVHYGRIAARRMPITYGEMIEMVRAVHPDIWIPSEAEFWAEYGYIAA